MDEEPEMKTSESAPDWIGVLAAIPAIMSVAGAKFEKLHAYPFWNVCLGVLIAVMMKHFLPRLLFTLIYAPVCFTILPPNRCQPTL